ncbi:MAG: GNAT family N-acetyltransferase [Brevinema sp.]
MYYGKKTLLRAYQESDILPSYYLIENFEIKSLLIADTILPYSLDEQKEFIKNATTRPCYHFAIVKYKGEYIGGCGINTYDTRTQTATIGIWIGQPYQNKGYGADALNTFCVFLFEEMNVRKIKLNYFSFNTKASKLYQKMGFQEEGILRQEIFRKGKYHDIHLMGMFREEFTPAK